MSSIRAQSGPAAAGILTEADVPRPTDPYGRSKLAAETAVAKSGVPFTVLRPVLVYGPGVKGNLRTLMRLAALPVPLPFGALTNRRSLVGIDNLVGAIIHVLGHAASRGETYVVADPRPVSVAEIMAALRSRHGPEAVAGCGPAGGDTAWPGDGRPRPRLRADRRRAGGKPAQAHRIGMASRCGHLGRTCRDGPSGRGGMTAICQMQC